MLTIDNIPPSTHFFVGYSGGLDSHVLLHALCHLLPVGHLTAVHINHQLSPHASQWQSHCEAVCRDLNIPLITHTLHLTKAKGDSLEALARHARYRCFAEHLQTNTCLVTAHHQDDQAETVLLQLLRGSGPHGLAAMPSLTEFVDGQHWRPLLDCAREQIEEYAKHYGLHWVDDESNANTDFSRNFLRHEILPRLKSHWPSASKTISRSAKHAAHAAAILNTQAEADWSVAVDPQANTLCIDKLSGLSKPRQNNLLRFWIRNSGYPVPSDTKLHEIHKTLLSARIDANPIVDWQTTEVRRYNGKLYVSPPHAAFKKMSLPWHNLSESLVLPNNLGVLEAQRADDGVMIAKDAVIEIRFRVGGERIQPQGDNHHRSLKYLLQKWQVPTWQRDAIPLLYVNNVLQSVIGYCIAEQASHHQSSHAQGIYIKHHKA